MAENKYKDNKIEKLSGRRPEEMLSERDISTHENLDRLTNRPREFEKLKDAPAPGPSAENNLSFPSAGNDQLDKFYNDIDEKKRGDIQKVINVIFEKGLEEGVLAARAMNDPYVLDEIEKLLTTDWMHKILLERGLLHESK